jgi:flagellar motility protein MotE (MotC chaperone)
MIFLILLITLNNGFTQTEIKLYSESEFQKKLSEEVVKKVSKFKGQDLTVYIAELMKKEKALEDRENKLKDEKTQLGISMENFEKRVNTHLKKENDLLGCIDTVKGEEDKRISRMVEIISTMKPDKAAQVLSIQDQELTIKILGLLDSKLVSKIFNLMDKEISARLQKQFMTMKR